MRKQCYDVVTVCQVVLAIFTQAFPPCGTYRQNSDISRIFVGNKIVDHLNVVGASPVGAALTC